MDPDTLQNLGTLGAAGVAGALGMAAGAARLRQRLSRDETERTKDRVESEFVTTLLAERDKALAEARDALLARQQHVETIARLTSQNEYQQEEINRLLREFESLKRRLVRLYPPTRSYLDSNFSVSDELTRQGEPDAPPAEPAPAPEPPPAAEPPPPPAPPPPAPPPKTGRRATDT